MYLKPYDIINFFGLLIMIYRHKINYDGFPKNSGMNQKIKILYLQGTG